MKPGASSSGGGGGTISRGDRIGDPNRLGGPIGIRPCRMSPDRGVGGAGGRLSSSTRSRRGSVIGAGMSCSLVGAFRLMDAALAESGL